MGSVHAVTENGQVLTASVSGSRAGSLCCPRRESDLDFWVVETVLTPATAMERLEMYAFPLEDARMHERGDLVLLVIGKILIVNGYRPGNNHGRHRAPAHRLLI